MMFFARGGKCGPTRGASGVARSATRPASSASASAPMPNPASRKKCRRVIRFTASSLAIRISLLRLRLVQVEQHVRHHGPGGKLVPLRVRRRNRGEALEQLGGRPLPGDPDFLALVQRDKVPEVLG